MTAALLLMLLAVQDTTAGKIVYQKWCAGCHGDNGAGDGEGARHMIPPPRDFTGNALYQIRSTPSGQLPTDADLLRSIDEGLPGTAMPAWKTRLSDRQRRDVLAYVKAFSPYFADTTQRPQPVAQGNARGARRHPRAAHEGIAAFAGRFRLDVRGPVLVPARGPDRPQGALVRAGRVRRVGEGGAYRGLDRAARGVGRPFG